MIMVERGALAIPAKKPAIPTTTYAPGSGAMAGRSMFRASPIKPPTDAPITMDGPKIPALPPLPMLKDVVRILANIRINRSRMLK